VVGGQAVTGRLSAIIPQTSKGSIVPDRRIYVLSPRELSPETIAVAFAKTSRSPETFEEIAAAHGREVAKFHEKWVVGYGTPRWLNMRYCTSPSRTFRAWQLNPLNPTAWPPTLRNPPRYKNGSRAIFTRRGLRGHVLVDEYMRVCNLLFSTYREALNP